MVWIDHFLMQKCVVSSLWLLRITLPWTFPYTPLRGRVFASLLEWNFWVTVSGCLTIGETAKLFPVVVVPLSTSTDMARELKLLLPSGGVVSLFVWVLLTGRPCDFICIPQWIPTLNIFVCALIGHLSIFCEMSVPAFANFLLACLSYYWDVNFINILKVLFVRYCDMCCKYLLSLQLAFSFPE